MSETPHPPDAYRGKPQGSRQGRRFVEFPSYSFTSVRMLPQLTGKPWDEIALGYVQGLRPTQLRVVERGHIQLDGETWRVTVSLGADGLIEWISQEIRVGLPEGIRHASHLQTALECGRGSPESLWESVPCRMVCHNGDETYKLLHDGSKLPYPIPADPPPPAPDAPASS